MKMSVECLYCLLRSMERNYTKVEKDPDKQMSFLRTVCGMIADADNQLPAPALAARVMAMIAKHADTQDLFEKEKHEYNQVILKMQDDIWQHIQEADDKLYRALQYAMAGNYIDFGVSGSISEDKLHELIESATDMSLGDTYERFAKELESARSLVYLLDNCGEVVFDKMCLAEIKSLYPNLKITAVVRGLPTYNDVTMVDAHEVGLTDLVEVIGNGTDIPGTILDKIDLSTRRVIEDADIVISKGMGNYETLEGCGLNIYYLLLCKCNYFMKRFEMPHLASVFASEITP